MADKTTRVGIYYDDEMLANEAIVKAEMKRLGIKTSRANIVRYLLAREVRRIRKRNQKET